MKKIFFYLIINIVCSLTASAQTFAYIEEDSVGNSYFQLSKNRNRYNTNLFFPYDGGSQGFDLTLQGLNKDSYYVIEQQKEFVIVEHTQIDIPVFFTSNVKSIDVFVFDKSGIKHSVNIKISNEGYQPSFRDKFQKQDAKTEKVDNNIYIKLTKKDDSKPAQVVFSDFRIADLFQRKVVSPLPFFKDLFAYNQHNASNKLSKAFINSISNTDWFSLEYCKSPIKINSDVNSEEANKRLLFDLLKKSISEYLFFEEKGKVKASVLKELESIWKTDSLKSECDLAESFQNFLRKTFHDGHFKIDLICKKDKKVLGPIRVYPINGKYLVSAVLDNELEKELPLESQLISLNHKPIHKIVDSLVNSLFSEDFLKKREQLVLQELSKDIVAFDEGANVTLEYLKPDQVKKEVTVTYKKKYPVKPNFANPHCEYRNIDSQTAYFKFNSFDELPVLRFQSIVDTIAHKNIIIDIRSNGGGDLAYVDDFLSFFINKQTANLMEGVSRSGLERDSLIFTNQNSHRINEKNKVVVLVDSKTACSSEIFINNLRKYRPNTTIIGTDNTLGALAIAYYVVLPTKNYAITLNAPGVYKHSFGYPLEDVGVSPDIKVNINSIYDLKPYNDKVLQKAIEVLNPTKETKPKLIKESDK